jgi:hypothetical protein
MRLQRVQEPGGDVNCANFKSADGEVLRCGVKRAQGSRLFAADCRMVSGAIQLRAAGQMPAIYLTSMLSLLVVFPTHLS